MTETEITEDLANEFGWDRITRILDDDGVLLQRLTEFDDGTTKFETFEGGIRRATELTDPGDPFSNPDGVKPWTAIQITYDDRGLLATRFETRDDGVQSFAEYDAGIIRSKEEVDFGEFGVPSDARSWERRITEYDEDGKKATFYQVADDGVQTFSQFDAGVIRSKEELDFGEFGVPSDARSWERRVTEYDENGDKATFYQVADDGVQTFSQFDAGVIRSKEEVDLGEFGAPSDARSWERRITEYDEDGKRSTLFQENDDGTAAFSEFDAGTIRSKSLEDRGPFGGPSDTKSWDSIEFRYDETGRIEAKGTLFDDGDMTIVLFEEGVRALQFELDGDGDQSWYARETRYDTDGSVLERITYATADDVPPDYFVVDPVLTF